MKSKDIQIGEIYNMKYFKTIQRPVRVIKVGTYKAQIEYLDSKTLETIAVPNPKFWGATTESVVLSSIVNKYQEAK